MWVNGNKPGYVQFVGGTQFAPGQWAGIVLDEAIGKNDGSVAGVRYFQCQDGRGIFTRPSKLARAPAPEREANGRQGSPAPAPEAEAGGGAEPPSSEPPRAPGAPTAPTAPAGESTGRSDCRAAATRH